LGDKDVTGFLSELVNVVDEIIVTENSSPRAMPTEELFKIAMSIFEDEQVSSAGSIARAIEMAIDKASHPTQSVGILVTGSVITVGQARALLKRGEQS
jgi:dihydrofolate synthase/folylpolyglutamate synthase